MVRLVLEGGSADGERGNGRRWLCGRGGMGDYRWMRFSGGGKEGTGGEACGRTIELETPISLVRSAPDTALSKLLESRVEQASKNVPGLLVLEHQVDLHWGRRRGLAAKDAGEWSAGALAPFLPRRRVRGQSGVAGQGAPFPRTPGVVERAEARGRRGVAGRSWVGGAPTSSVGLSSSPEQLAIVSSYIVVHSLRCLWSSSSSSSRSSGIASIEAASRSERGAAAGSASARGEVSRTVRSLLLSDLSDF